MEHSTVTPTAGAAGAHGRRHSEGTGRQREAANGRRTWRTSRERERFDEETIAYLKGMMPQAITMLLGVEDLSRPFRCPLPDHDDRTPSAHYFADANIVRCFGCGRTLDVFDLVGAVRGIDGFPDRVRATAELLGVELASGRAQARTRPADVRRKPARPPAAKELEPVGTDDLLPQVMDAYDRLYTPKGDFSRAWLHHRGIDDDAIVRCGLGLAVSPHDVSEHFSVHEDVAVYVVVPYPNRDFGEVRYAVLRTVVPKGKVPRRKEWRMKGVRSPLYREWTLSSGLPSVAVCEGPLDAIALESRHPWLQTMALGGTSMARRFLAVMEATGKPLRPQVVVLALDEDDAGRACAKRLEEGLARLGVRCKRYPGFGGHKDPGDWLCAQKGTCWHYELTPLGGLRVPHGRIVWEES